MAKILNVHENDTNVYTESVVNGIDTSNIIATNPTMPYTVTEDCYIAAGINVKPYASTYIKIDGRDVFGHVSGAADFHFINTIVARKGQVVTADNAFEVIYIYGIKR